MDILDMVTLVQPWTNVASYTIPGRCPWKLEIPGYSSDNYLIPGLMLSCCCILNTGGWLLCMGAIQRMVWVF